jgi:gliding motility-associated-like protein
MKRILQSIIILLFCIFFQAKSQPNQTVVKGTSTTAVNFPGTGCVYNWVNDEPGIGLPASGTGNIPSFTAINNGSGPVTAAIKATPAPTGFGYITNAGSNNVSVIDISTNSVVATVPVGSNPIGVAISPDGQRVYVSNKGSKSVSVINTSNNTVASAITVGNSPIGLGVSPDGSKVYIANSGDGTISIINTATNAVSATIAVGLQPTGIAISPNGNYVYVTNYLDGTVSVMNAATNTIASLINIGPNPVGIAISPDGSQLYVANNSQYLSVVKTATNLIVAKIPLDIEYPVDPRAIAVSPNGKIVFVADVNGNGVAMVTVADPVFGIFGFARLPGSSAYGVSLSADGNKLYVVTYGGSVDVIDVSDPTNATNDSDVQAYIGVGTTPQTFGNFISGGTGCSGTPVAFTITVNAQAPAITTSAVTGTISACAGSPSASPNIQQFTVSATGLTNDITATAPPNFEVSLSAVSGYANSVILKQSAGLITGAIVYVRSAASAATGNISGNVVLASAGVASQNVAVDGVVNALPTVNAISNQTYKNGDVITAINFTGTGNTFNWVNDTPAIGLAASGTGDIAPFTATNNGAGALTATVTVTPVLGAYAYVANGGDGNVSVINTTTHALMTTIPVGQDPTFVSVSPDGKRVYVVNNSSNSISVINTGSNKVVTEIPVGSTNQVIVSPDNKLLYVADYGITTNIIRVINANTFAEAASIPLSGQPGGIAINADGSKLYVTNPLDGTVSVIDIATKTITATINVNSQPQGILVSPDGARIYVTNFFSNSVSVINTATNVIESVISTPANPDAIAISPDGSNIYVANYGNGSVTVINTATATVLAIIATGTHPSAVDVSADGAFVYVVNQGANSMSIISTATNAVTTTVPTGASPNSPGKFIVNGTGCTGVPVTFTIKVNALAPVITPSAVTGTITACAGSPSATPNIQQFTISGSGLSGNITATAPIGFEVSLSANSGFANSVTLTRTSGSVTNVVVYVRSANYAIGSVSGDVDLSTPGLPSQTVPVRGFVNSLPTVTAIDNQTKTGGESTDAITFAGTGDSYTWTNDKPEIGLPASGTGDIASFITVNNGALPIVATITVIPSPASGGCEGKPITFTITVGQSLPPAISNDQPPNGVNTVYGTPSPVTSFIISGRDMREGIKVTPLAGVEVSIDNINFSNTIMVGAAGTIAPTTIYVRLAKTTPVGSYEGSIILSSTGVNTIYPQLPVSVVSPAPLKVTANTKSKDYGAVLTSSTGSADFTITGLQNDETAQTVSIAYGQGAAAADPVGTYTGSVTPAGLTGGTFDPKNYSPVYVNGDMTINKVPLTITADNKSKTYKDPNPILTVTYNGFVNNEGSVRLTSLPVISTKADETSVPGKYPILVSGATALNYNIAFVNGILTVLGINTPLKIPNTFTPNDDGINDTWNIVNIDNYPNCIVNIYNRWGQNIFSSIGYGKSWDGKYKGVDLPAGTYYYVIDLRNGLKLLSGSITIIR